VRIRHPQTRSALAAEYVLGTLKGAARQRFERELLSGPALKAEVEVWQARLVPLTDAVEPATPPRRVWQAIEARIQGRARPSGLWHSLAFWRGMSALCVSAMLALVIVLTQGPANLLEKKERMVVVMSDSRAQPMMTVTWPMHGDDGKLRIRVIGHQEMAPDTAWELWMLPDPKGKPRSLGLITTHETQEVSLPPGLMPAVNAAWGMAMSVEPKGGSPTGVPSGEVLYSGQCTKLQGKQ